MILTVTPNPCVDKTVFVDRIALGTVHRAPRYTTIAGGKGCNVARAVRALGGNARPLVLVGGPTGHHVVEMLRGNDGLDPVPVWVGGHTRTITTVLEEALHRQTPFFEPGSRVTEEEATTLLAAFDEAVYPGVDLVTLNGTVPDPALRELYPQLIEAARNYDVPVLLDAHGPEYEAGLRAQPDYTKPNVAELEKLLGRALPDEAACWDAVREVRETYGVEAVLLSRGAQPLLADCAGTRFKVFPPAIQEVNPVGSGDAFVAGFSLARMQGKPLEEALRLGAAAGAANARTWDIGHFSYEEVEALLPGVRVEGL